MKTYADIFWAMTNRGRWGTFLIDLDKGPAAMVTSDALEYDGNNYVATVALTISAQSDIEQAIADGRLRRGA